MATTKPSNAPWADEPFKLIEIPALKIKNDHYAIEAASEMANAHNVLIRGLNAIIQQGPHISSTSTSSSSSYSSKDVKDFLAYVHIWIETVHHHHSVEETFLFPEIEKVSGGKKGMMDEAKGQHEGFQKGLKELDEYALRKREEGVEGGEYKWEGEGGMKRIVDGFSKDLVEHLYEEIEVFLGLRVLLDSEEFRRTGERAQEVAKSSGNIGLLYTLVPMVLGTADRTYPGSADFPPFGWFMPYLVNYWFGVGNGAWRFHPCDFWGRPRPLAFVGK
ncbi:hypothetical protein GGS20DRAFT_581145 [Poronia punctata]|nr:hypothetical protein GGS20DRAFT_581145 [Poronia punctata]